MLKLKLLLLFCCANYGFMANAAVVFEIKNNESRAIKYMVDHDDKTTPRVAKLIASGDKKSESVGVKIFTIFVFGENDKYPDVIFRGKAFEPKADFLKKLRDSSDKLINLEFPKYFVSVTP